MDNNRLVIRDYPVLLWTVGILVLALAVYTYRVADPLTAALIALLGLMCLVLPSTLTIIADRQTRTLTLHYGLLIPRGEKVIPFSEIQSIEVDYTRSGRGYRYKHRSSFRVLLVKKDGTIVPFHAYYSTGLKPKERIVEKLNEFLGHY